mgnify:CR=1 FL=1
MNVFTVFMDTLTNDIYKRSKYSLTPTSAGSIIATAGALGAIIAIITMKYFSRKTLFLLGHGL